MQSEHLNELFTALAKAQGQMRGTQKDSKNSFLKNEYSSLSSCWEGCRQALSANGLSVIQSIMDQEGKNYLITILGHSSGQYIQSKILLSPGKPDPQSMGSLITYMRRYALVALIGLYSADDDAEGAMGDHRDPAPVQSPAPQLTMDQFVGRLREMSGNNFALWRMDEYLNYLNKKSKDEGKDHSVVYIMHQALIPERALSFCRGWQKWSEGK